MSTRALRLQLGEKNPPGYLLFENIYDVRMYVIILYLLYSFFERRYIKFLDSGLNRKDNSSKYISATRD